ncbi:MAG: hypothetical protein FJX75_08020 [Armatimonadetes bacterium]|nr:hypothetical protein [Armatimonadota bacterium]
MATVVDTNVWAVAAGGHPDAGPRCVERCASRLLALGETDILAVDSDYRILGEYYDNLPANSAQVLLLNRLQQTGRYDPRPCEWEPTAPGVAVVPESLEALDPNDRKFAAVALTYDPPAPIWNASDPGWSKCADACRAEGLTVVELCPEALASMGRDVLRC